MPSVTSFKISETQISIRPRKRSRVLNLSLAYAFSWETGDRRFWMILPASWFTQMIFSVNILVEFKIVLKRNNRILKYYLIATYKSKANGVCMREKEPLWKFPRDSDCYFGRFLVSFMEIQNSAHSGPKLPIRPRINTYLLMDNCHRCHASLKHILACSAQVFTLSFEISEQVNMCSVINSETWKLRTNLGRKGVGRGWRQEGWCAGRRTSSSRFVLRIHAGTPLLKEAGHRRFRQRPNSLSSLFQLLSQRWIKDTRRHSVFSRDHVHSQRLEKYAIATPRLILWALQ